MIQKSLEPAGRGYKRWREEHYAHRSIIDNHERLCGTGWHGGGSHCPSPARTLTGLPLVPMIVLGIVLLILGFVFGIHLLWVLGVVLLVIGAVLWIMGSVGRPVAGRRYWY